jgi:hypothetical protein
MFSLETAPLILIWPALVVALVVAHEAGFFVFKLVHRVKAGSTAGDDNGIGYLVSAVFALLGLLIAFTFSMAANRYDARRALVVAEANAIGTTYLRFQVLDEPARVELSRLMLPYIEAREQFFAADDAEKVVAADERTNDLQEQIWRKLAVAIRAQQNATTNPSILETTNEMFDLAARDRAAIEGRVPISILRVVIGYSMIAAGLIGYALAAKRSRYFIASTAVFVLFALSISLILDLDRPRSGSVTVSTAPFSRAADNIRSMDSAGELQPEVR